MLPTPARSCDRGPRGRTACRGLSARPPRAEALLVVEADTGKVLHAEHATHPWYPASITKIMTAYVTLQAP